MKTQKQQRKRTLSDTAIKELKTTLSEIQQAADPIEALSILVGNVAFEMGLEFGMRWDEEDQIVLQDRVLEDVLMPLARM